MAGRGAAADGREGSPPPTPMEKEGSLGPTATKILGTQGEVDVDSLIKALDEAGGEQQSLARLLAKSRAEEARLREELQRERRQLQESREEVDHLRAELKKERSQLGWALTELRRRGLSMVDALRHLHQGALYNRRAARTMSMRVDEDYDAEDNDCMDDNHEWTAAGWLRSIDLSGALLRALKVPEGEGQLKYIRELKKDKITKHLRKASLLGHEAAILQEIQLLQAPGSVVSELNAKFQSEGSFELSFGTLDRFYAGLTGLLGPVRQIDGSIKRAMEYEHCKEIDSTAEFTSSNGVTTHSRLEWEFVNDPDEFHEYPDRFPKGDDRRRKVRSLEETLELMCEKNAELCKHGHGGLVEEEAVAATLYTGPMYEKYNLVLRSMTGASSLKAKFDHTCQGNLYATTIHCVNSAIVKLSKVTRACVLWRGITQGKLPESFTKKNELNLRGGIEFGFTSMTRDRAQAELYASGAASTLFQARQGLVDRGADVRFMSQYPHEAEVIFSPLLGLEMVGSTVDQGVLVVDIRLNLNLSSETLDSIKAKRYTLMKDAAKNMVLEIRASAADLHNPGPFADLAEAAFRDFALKEANPEWYTVDENLKQCVTQLIDIRSTVRSMQDKRDHELLDALARFKTLYKVDSLTALRLQAGKGGQEELLGQTSKLDEDSIVFSFPKLQTLSLYSTALTHLPEKLGGLSELQEVELRCFGLWQLPKSIGQLKKLRVLSLRHSGVEELPESLGELQVLRELNLDYCSSLKELPHSLGKLAVLEELSMVRCNSVKMLPASTCDLKNLKRLNLLGRTTEEMGEAEYPLGELAALEELNLSRWNRLQRLPASLRRLTSLKKLDVSSDNGLGELPAWLGELAALEELTVASPKLRKVPVGIGSLKKLRRLDLGDCRQLEELPESLGSMEALEELILLRCNCQLRRLPESIGRLKRLKRLNLMLCEQLEELPDSLGDLAALQELNLDYCEKLEVLPDSAIRLQALRKLDVRHASIAEDNRLVDSLEQALQSLQVHRLPTVR